MRVSCPYTGLLSNIHILCAACLTAKLAWIIQVASITDKSQSALLRWVVYRSVLRSSSKATCTTVCPSSRVPAYAVRLLPRLTCLPSVSFSAGSFLLPAPDEDASNGSACMSSQFGGKPPCGTSSRFESLGQVRNLPSCNWPAISHQSQLAPMDAPVSPGACRESLSRPRRQICPSQMLLTVTALYSNQSFCACFLPQQLAQRECPQERQRG